MIIIKMVEKMKVSYISKMCRFTSIQPRGLKSHPYIHTCSSCVKEAIRPLPRILSRCPQNPARIPKRTSSYFFLNSVLQNGSTNPVSPKSSSFTGSSTISFPLMQISSISAPTLAHIHGSVAKRRNTPMHSSVARRRSVIWRRTLPYTSSKTG